MYNNTKYTKNELSMGYVRVIKTKTRKRFGNEKTLSSKGICTISGYNETI